MSYVNSTCIVLDSITRPGGQLGLDKCKVDGHKSRKMVVEPQDSNIQIDSLNDLKLRTLINQNHDLKYTVKWSQWPNRGSKLGGLSEGLAKTSNTRSTQWYEIVLVSVLNRL